MRRIVLFIAVAFASLVLAPSARAQFVYEDVQWGIDVAATTAALAAHGFVLNTEFVPDEGELLYEGEDDVLAMATFSGERLVGLRFIYAGTADEVEDMYAQSIAESRQSLGEPASEEDDVVAWESGDTWYSVMLGEVDAGPYVAVQFAGPGYSEEIARRTDGGSPVARREFPPLEERWAVVQETPEFRTAVDRSTIVPQGNRIVRAWAREDYSTPRVMHISYDQVVYQMDYDCAQRRVRLVTAVYRLNGERVQNDVAEAGEPWTSMEPETSGESVLLTICEAGGRR